MRHAPRRVRDGRRPHVPIARYRVTLLFKVRDRGRRSNGAVNDRPRGPYFAVAVWISADGGLNAATRDAEETNVARRVSTNETRKPIEPGGVGAVHG